MRKLWYFILLIILLLSLYLVFTGYQSRLSEHKLNRVQGELFISDYLGYVCGFVNETVRLDVYWMTLNKNDFSGAIGVRNLPDFVKVDKIEFHRTVFFEDPRLKEQTIQIYLKLMKPGIYRLENAYLEIYRSRENKTIKLPLGHIVFEILERKNIPMLEIKRFMIGFITPYRNISPEYRFTIYNPTSKNVLLRNITISVPGLRIVKITCSKDCFSPIPPDGEKNITIIMQLETPSKLYIIKPKIEYQVGSNTYYMPSKPYYLVVIPNAEEIKKIIVNNQAS